MSVETISHLQLVLPCDAEEGCGGCGAAGGELDDGGLLSDPEAAATGNGAASVDLDDVPPNNDGCR